jgi:CheY-like chemotaxis protein
LDTSDIKILLIDDEPDFTQPMSFWLKSKGYFVAVANDGKSGLKMIKENIPNAVFLDLNMPDMDGLMALKKIRKISKDLPVIVISAYVDDKRVNDVMASGISGVFCKSKDFEETISLLKVVLQKHKGIKDA